MARLPGTSYSTEIVRLAVSLVLDAAASLRSCGASIDLFFSLQYGLPLQAPSHVTIQNYILRMGLFELQREKEKADDWIWIVDHTIQIGKTKVLLIVGIRMSHWEQLRRPLEHRDLQVLELKPVEHSSGEIVDQQMEGVAEKYGVPKAIVSDQGSDLLKGYGFFHVRHRDTVRSSDIAHLVASLLRGLLVKNERWNSFISAAGTAKAKLQQTSLAHLIPPTLKPKARYMNLDELTAWGAKVRDLVRTSSEGRLSQEQQKDLPAELLSQRLGWIEDYAEELEDWSAMAKLGAATRDLLRVEGYHSTCPAALDQRLESPTGRLASKFREALLAAVTAESSKAKSGERLLASSEVLESLIGKGKRLEGQQSRSGFTRNVLSLAAAVVEPTGDAIRQAMQCVGIKHLAMWCRDALPKSVQSKRRRDLPTEKQKQNQDNVNRLPIPSF